MGAVSDEIEPAPFRKAQRWLRWVGYIAGGLVSLLLVLGCVGAVYQWVASSRDRRLNHPPGQLVDVGGYRMHMYCIGQGAPTVVLDSGIGDSWLAWYKVQPQIAQFTRVCSYDRAGLGWSDPSPKRRTSRVIAEELHTLLRSAGIAAPLVLVGHSFGGMNMRMYASLYRQEVVGMVLVDSTHPDQEKRFGPALRKYNDKFLRKEDLKQHTMPFGIPRLMGWCGSGPPELRPMLRAIECRFQPWLEHLAEYNAREESAAQVRAGGSLGDIPLVVLSQGRGGELWSQMQEEFVHLSSNGSRVIAEGSGHEIQKERPDLVIKAVRKVVEQSGGEG